MFATKEDLRTLEEKMATKDQFRQVMTIIDNLVGEVRAFRQEMTFLNHRVEKIESTPTVASELRKKK